MDADSTALRQALQITIVVDELLIYVLNDAGLAEQVPALLHIEQTLHVVVGIEFFVALHAHHNIRIGDGDIPGDVYRRLHLHPGLALHRRHNRRFLPDAFREHLLD